MKLAPAKKKSQELTRLGSALRSLGGLGGSALGALVGMPTAGSQTGMQLGAMLSRWLGSGDYSVSKNSLVSSVRASGEIPMMHSSGQTIVVRHREYLGDILSSTNFAISNTYPLNPGLESSFPWLAQLAANYQEYTWKGAVYHYVPTSGASVASTNTALGSVMISTNYRSTAPAYTNKQQMLNDFFATDARPTEPFCHPIECDPKENPYNVQYIRTASVPTGEDPKTYDLGVVTVATQGCPATGNALGELWVTYEIELRKPKLTSTGLPFGSYYKVDRTGTITQPNSLLGTTSNTALSNIAVTISANTITWPRNTFGTFVVIVSFAADSITAYGQIIPTATNCTVNANLFPNGTTITAGGYFANAYFNVVITDVTSVPSLQLTGSAFAGTCASVSIRLFEVNALAAF